MFMSYSQLNALKQEGWRIWSYSQTLSCLLAIQNLQAESGYVMKFLKNYTAQVNTGITILLCWVPGHVGIKGNEQADDMAKIALHSSISAVKYPPSDLYHDVTSLCHKLWQADWDQHTPRRIILATNNNSYNLGYCKVSHSKNLKINEHKTTLFDKNGNS